MVAAVALGLLGASSTARAHDDYPGIVQKTFGVGCPPPCTLCHVKPTGGLPVKEAQFETYTAPHRGFGRFVTNLRATPGGPLTRDSLSAKLEALAGQCHWDKAHGDTSDPEPCDSDGDTVSDYEELLESHDPDEPGKGVDVSCPKYGCGASSIGALPRSERDVERTVALTVVLGGLIVGVRRRTRRT